MAKRKTCFVTDWVDDTPALGPNGDAGQRPFLIREDTSTFLRDVLHLLTWMDNFLNVVFVFGVAAGQGLGRARTHGVEMRQILSLQLVARSAVALSGPPNPTCSIYFSFSSMKHFLSQCP